MKPVDFETITQHLSENLKNEDYQAAAAQAAIEAQGLSEEFDKVDDGSQTIRLQQLDKKHVPMTAGEKPKVDQKPKQVKQQPGKNLEK